MLGKLGARETYSLAGTRLKRTIYANMHVIHTTYLMLLFIYAMF